MLCIEVEGWLTQQPRTVTLLKTRRARSFAVTVDGEPWLVRGKPLVCGIAEAFERIGRRIVRPLPERSI